MASKITRKCICQICVCGKHRCPHNESHQDRVIIKAVQTNCLVSEYGQRFQDAQPTRGPFHKPKDSIASKGEFDLDTINKTDYVLHNIKPRKLKEPEKYVPKSGKIDLITEYNANYVGEKSTPSRIPRYLTSVTQRIPSGIIAKESVQKADFQAWKLDKRKLFTKNNEYSPPQSQFTATSIHRADFQRFNQPHQPTARNPDQIDTSGLPMHFETTQNNDFRKYDVPIKHIKRQYEYIPPSKPFDGKSLFQGDFPMHNNARKASIFKPITTVLKSNSPLQNKTTNTEDFRNWPTEPLKIKSKEMYIKPIGTMELKPTSHDYRVFGQEGLPAKSARPKTKLKTGREGQFNGISSYMTCFKSWDVAPAKPIRHVDELRRSNPLKFTENSEQRDEYKRFCTAPARIFKPISDLFKTNDKLDNKSLYASDFEGNQGPQCLSEKLLKDKLPAAGYRFEDDPDSGHRFVVKLRGNEDEQAALKILPPIAACDGVVIGNHTQTNTTPLITA